MTSWFRGWIRRSPLIAFFVLVFGMQWLLVLALLVLPSPVPALVAVLIGSWLPNGIGLPVTGVAGGGLTWRVPDLSADSRRSGRVESFLRLTVV